MHGLLERLRGVGCAISRGRFYATGEPSSLLASTVGELTSSQIVYSLDTLGRSKVKDWNLWEHLCNRIRFELDSLEVPDLLKITHSLAKVSYRKLSLLSVINRIVLRKHAAVDTRGLTQYLIDLNKLEVLDANTFVTLVNLKLPGELSFFSTFDLSFLLHLCSKLQYRDPAVIDAISTKLLQNDSDYRGLCSVGLDFITPQDMVLLAMVLRSLAFLQHKNELYRDILFNRIPPLVYRLGSQELCNVLLSIVVSHVNDPIEGRVGEIVGAILDRVGDMLPSLVEIELGICLHYLKHNLDPFPERFQRLLDSIVSLGIKYTPSTSKMQLKLGRLLDEIKLKYESESQVGPYRLDYVVPKLKVAIEVNGYTHFFHNSRELNAITQLKYKILRDMGWNVVGVDYFNWKNRNKQSRMEYLVGKLSPFLAK